MLKMVVGITSLFLVNIVQSFWDQEFSLSFYEDYLKTCSFVIKDSNVKIYISLINYKAN